MKETITIDKEHAAQILRALEMDWEDYSDTTKERLCALAELFGLIPNSKLRMMKMDAAYRLGIKYRAKFEGEKPVKDRRANKNTDYE
jgi:hypothetical protein